MRKRNIAITQQALTFLASLAAILLLIALARWLRLGAEPRLADDAEAAAVAADLVPEFQVAWIGRDREGRGAVIQGADGGLLLIAPHGAQWFARTLTPAAKVSGSGSTLVITTGETRLAPVTLVLDDALAWRAAIEALK